MNGAVTAHQTRIGALARQFTTAWIPFGIALVTVLGFAPALWNGFAWDDEVNLLGNPHYRGLGWTQLRWMFTTDRMGHWIPITWLTFGIDYVLWGMNPFGYHLTNLLLHSANAAVFYFVALHLLGLAMPQSGPVTGRLGAATAALFFAVHPLRAESVAWLTERRDVLSGLFFLLAILTYLRASKTEGRRRLGLLASSVGCYALALASKSIVMTLPFVLIVLDIYPLRRLGGRWREWASPAARSIWIEKIPYLLLALAAGTKALYTVAPALTPLAEYSISARIAMAVYSLGFYLWKTLVPSELSPLHELAARVDPFAPSFLLIAIAVAGITVGLSLKRRRWPAGLAVWAAYAVMLAPVNGLVHAGPQLVADRYSYLSCLGWALLVGAGVCAVARGAATGTLKLAMARLAAGAAAVWFIGLGLLTWQQVQVWRDSETLWIYALAIDPGCSSCHENLGAMLLERGQPVLAIEHFQRALALRPEWVRTHWRLGLALLHAGRPAEAVPHFREVLNRSSLDGDITSSHEHLGLALLHAGRPAEAVPHFREVLKRSTPDADILNHLGVALVQQGKSTEGMEHLRQAIRLDPTRAEFHTNLGMALIGVGRAAEAVEHFVRAIALSPEIPQPHFGLARAYLALGKTSAALEEYAVLNRLDPGLASQLSPLLH